VVAKACLRFGIADARPSLQTATTARSLGFYLRSIRYSVIDTMSPCRTWRSHYGLIAASSCTAIGAQASGVSDGHSFVTVTLGGAQVDVNCS
jgi:hypothetical protein